MHLQRNITPLLNIFSSLLSNSYIEKHRLKFIHFYVFKKYGFFFLQKFFKIKLPSFFVSRLTAKSETFHTSLSYHPTSTVVDIRFRFVIVDNAYFGWTRPVLVCGLVRLKPPFRSHFASRFVPFWSFILPCSSRFWNF